MNTLIVLAAGVACGAEPGNFAPPPAKPAAANLAPPAPPPKADPPRPVPPKSAPARDYDACVAAVDRGETVYLCVGVYTTQGEYFVPELKGIKDGCYECKLIDGRRDTLAVDPKTHKPLVQKAAVGPSGQPYPQPGRDPNEDHKCPNCGTYQYYHSATMPDGSHTHTCPNCGTSWSHGGPLGYPGTRGQGGVKAQPVPQAQPQYTPPRYQPPPQYQPFGGGIQFGLSGPGMSFGGCVGGG